MIFKNQLTIGIILPTETTPHWHMGFADSFAPYFEQKYGAVVVYGVDVDSLLATCKTKYLIVQSVSHVIHNPTFFSRLAALESNMVVGYVQHTHEYAYLEDSCLFFNMEQWEAADKPAYYSKLTIGTGFNKVDGGLERNGENAIMGREDAAKGGQLIATQLKKFGRLYEFPEDCDNATFLFEHKTPYHEIHFETLFEKTILPKRDKLVMHANGEELPDVADGIADVLITHASGLTPLILAEHYRVKKIIVIDQSDAALDFQRLLFSAESPVLYGDVYETFKEEHPNVEFVGDFEEDEYSVVTPLPDVEIIYKKVDVLSFEFEDFIKEVMDIDSSVVVNLDDIFILPLNFYKRKRDHAQGLFREIWSLLVSRTGPSRLIGCDAYGTWFNGVVINGETEKFNL